MATIPKVKVTFDADFDELKKGVKGATAEVESFGTKVADFGKKAGAAFALAAAAAGAYAIKIGVEGVKAAIADEKSQTQLALALENVTGATNKQIAATEEQILKMSLAYGVADDKLRPAMARLVRSTEDTEKAQQLLATALDISTATGKPLEGVANALGKAYDGNTAALGKLGIGLSSAELKTMNFTQVQTRLSDLFGGAAERNANTFSGRMERLKVTLDEAKEGIGYALLPILEKLVGYFTQYVVPVVEKLSNLFSNKEGGIGQNVAALGDKITNIFKPIWEGLVSAFNSVKTAISNNSDAFLSFGKLIADYVAPVLSVTLGAALNVVGKIAGTVINIIGGIIGAITTAVEGAIAAVNWLIGKYNSIPLLPNIPLIPVSGAPKVTMPSVPNITTPTVKTPTISVPAATSSGASSAASAAAGSGSSISTTGTAGVIGSFAAGTFRAAEAASTGAGDTINISVTGALDKEGVARQIVDLLNYSSARGGGGFQSLMQVV